MEKFNEDYFLRGPEKGLSNYRNYRWMPELTLPMAETLKKFLDAKEGETLLDYGCARGYLVKALRMLNIEAEGCDISTWAIKNCDPAVKEYVCHPEDLVGEYDYIFCKDVLEHIPEEELNRVLPEIFNMTKKSCLFIVPLSVTDNGPYVYPDDEKDSTHIHRKTLVSWIQFIQKFAKNFVVMGSLEIPVLKTPTKTYPGCAGFIFCKKFDK